MLLRPALDRALESLLVRAVKTAPLSLFDCYLKEALDLRNTHTVSSLSIIEDFQ